MRELLSKVVNIRMKTASIKKLWYALVILFVLGGYLAIPYMNSRKAEIKEEEQVLSPENWRVKVSSVPERKELAIDRDPSTRWDSGQPQSGEEWWEIDLGKTYRIHRVVLDHSLSPEDYPRAYQLLVSPAQGKEFVLIAKGQVQEPTGSLGIDLAYPPTARFLRIEQKGSSPNRFWSIHEIYVFATSAEGESVPFSIVSYGKQYGLYLGVPLALLLTMNFLIERQRVKLAAIVFSCALILTGWYLYDNSTSLHKLALAFYLWGGVSLFVAVGQILSSKLVLGYRIKRKERDKLGFKSELVLMSLSLAIYLVLIFERLTLFPVYFFCDEAVTGVDAHAIMTTGTDMFGNAWPILFRGLGDYALSLSVYLQVPFIWLFGLSEFTIRLKTACISLIGVGAVYFLLRCPFRMNSAWLTSAVFAVSPVWFLHSRTGFEYVIAVSFFLASGLFYILALTRRSLFIVPAAVCAAATFYSYTPGRGWITGALVLLFLMNIPEHFRCWKRILVGSTLFALLLTPYLYVHWKHPEAATKRLEALNFSQFKNKTLSQQAKQVIDNYAIGFNPAFWYTWKGTQNTGPMERHVIPPLPQLPVWTAPFALLGFSMMLWQIRKFKNRTLLALLLASPLPATLVGFNNARGMPVGVFLLVFSLLGAGWLFGYIQRWPRWERGIKVTIAIGLILYAIWFRHHVYEVARYSYQDYGFYGVQMGAPEIFKWVKENHSQYEGIRLSHKSFNAGYIFIPFYLKGETAQKTSVFDLDQICQYKPTLPDKTVYIAPINAYLELQATGCPIKKEVVGIIPDLNGKLLFEMILFHQGPNFEEWFNLEEKRRRELQKNGVEWKGKTVQVEHPPFDIGNVQSMFDGNLKTLARSARINPARVIIHLPKIEVKQVSVTISHTGAAMIQVKTRSDAEEKEWGEKQFLRSGDDPVTLTFEQTDLVLEVTELEINVHVTDVDQYGFVHINEIDWE